VKQKNKKIVYCEYCVKVLKRKSIDRGIARYKCPECDSVFCEECQYESYGVCLFCIPPKLKKISK